jgi:hypothetical protein
VALGVLGALVMAAIVLSGRPTVRLPRLQGLTETRISSELRHLHLTASFAGRWSAARPGTAVAQTPRAGTRIKQGSTIDVVLSKGPPPVSVPRLVGQTSSAAVEHLHRFGLKAALVQVPAPGITPGIVTGQSARAGRQLRPRSTVTLYVAETPTWRGVTSFSGTGAGQSVVFRIRGPRWRIAYTMSYDGTCDFVFFCNGPSAHVIGVGANSTDTSFDLSDGGAQTHVFKSGAGAYQIKITPGWDSARWSVRVEDWL